MNGKRSNVTKLKEVKVARPEKPARQPEQTPPWSASMAQDALRDSRASHPANASQSGKAVIQLQQQVGNQQAGQVMQDARSKRRGRRLDSDSRAELQAQKGSGQALDQNTRQQMEAATGHDLSQVRIHTDGAADQLNQKVDAAAFTTGRDVFFRQGRYNPTSTAGQHLLAHELTHVVQQSQGEVPRNEGQIRPAGDEYEQAANQLADSFIGRDTVTEAGTIQRQPLEEEEELLQLQPIEEEEELLQLQPIEEEEELLMP